MDSESCQQRMNSPLSMLKTQFKLQSSNASPGRALNYARVWYFNFADLVISGRHLNA
jgi:hypothetical protein